MPAAEKKAAEKAAAAAAAGTPAAAPAKAGESGADGQETGKSERRQRNRGPKKDGRKPDRGDARAKGGKPAGDEEAAAPRRRREETVGREVFEDEANEIKERAVSFLKEIFRVMEEEIEIDTDFNYQDNELSVSLSGGDMGVMIGKRGQTLDSLQYLVSLVVNKHRDVYIRVKLDTENYRERREQKLKSLARNIAHKVKRTRRSVALEPMNPYERRIIHSALQRDPYVTTCSEGEDPYRHVIVMMKKNPKGRDRYGRKSRDYAPETETAADTSAETAASFEAAESAAPAEESNS